MFFEKFRAQIRALFTGIPAHVREWGSHALTITSVIKSLLNNPIADVVVSIIPGDWDDKLKAAVLQAIDKAMPYLQIVDKCKAATTTDEMVKCWMTELALLPKDVQNAMLHKLAALLTAILDNKERKQSEYDYYIQLLYSGNKELKAS